MIDKKNHFPNTTFTLCALFTLAPNEPLFKTLDVKKKMYGGITELLMDQQIMSHFSDIFAKKPLRLLAYTCLLYTSPSPRDRQKSRMPSSA